MDVNKLKQRLKDLQSQTTTNNNFWKPEPGKTQIRIVPYKHNKDNPFVELYFYYIFGNKTYISPISFGRPDPIDEFAQTLKNSGDKDSWIQGKRLEPKMRTYVPVIVREQESEGVKFWGFGKTVYEELLGFIADPDYGDITDPINGRDIVVEKVLPQEAGNQYGKVTIRVKPNQVPLTDDKEIFKSITENQEEVSSLYNEPTYDELKDILKDYLNPNADKDNENDQIPNKKVSSTNNGAITETAKSVDDAFDKLFNS